MRALILMVLLCCIPALVSAQDVPPVPQGDVDVPPGENVIVILAEGARAPFSGQLFDPATAVRWGNRTIRYRARIQLLTEELRIAQAVNEASVARQLRIVEESYTREIEGLRTDLREQASRYEAELADFRNPPFYATWSFAFGVGILTFAAVVGVISGLVLSL